MNANCYKIIFSKHLGTLVAVGEHTTSTGKAASGQACRGVAHPTSFGGAMVDGFVGVLRLAFASVALACMTLSATQAQSNLGIVAATALPQGGSVNTGTANISTQGATMAIAQTTDKASINWQSFNVGTGASVNITQPSASSVLLNRVVGNDASQILGKLSANGQLILLNPNGIVFGKDGSVAASSFTASTFGLSDADFMDGFYKYNRNGSTAAVVNQGTIETSAGGFVALIGATVTNEGTIRAPQGDVMLVAAETVTLPASVGNNGTSNSNNTVSVRMSKRVRLELDPAAINTAVNNTESGVIVTEGGQVLLQAAALSTAVASVTHSGSIDTSAPQAGAVTVLAEGGSIKVNGSITANSNGSDGQGQQRKGGDIIIGRDEETGALAKFTDVSGAKLESQHGFVETSGEYLKTDGISVKAKEWLLDPSDITISSSADSNVTGVSPADITPNGATGTSSVVNVSTIQTAINAGTNVTIKTTNASNTTGSGNIAIANALTFNNSGPTDATLSLIADNGITQNAAASITTNVASAKLVNINMTASGNYQGSPAAHANSAGIELRSTINTNGRVTLDGTNNNTGAGSGVKFVGGSGITAASYAINGNKLGTATNSYGVLFATGTSSLTSTGTSSINGVSNGSTGAFAVGLMVDNGATLTLDAGAGAGSLVAKGSNPNATYQTGVRIGNGSIATITTKGNVTLGAKEDNSNFSLRSGVVTADSGSLTILGQSSYTSGISFFDGTSSIKSNNGASITLNGAATAGTYYGVVLNNTFIDAGTTGDVSITGTSVGNHGIYNPWTGSGAYNMKVLGRNISINGATSATNTSGFYSFVGSSAGNIITAAGDISITGTANGTGTGSGLYYSTTNWQTYVNSYTAGGSIALSGTNTSATNTAEAVRLFGVQAQTTGAGNISVNASTQNAGVNAITIYSAGALANGYQGGATSLVSTSGDVKIQTNQGGIILNDGVPNSVTSTTISGRNVSIDNTGGTIDATTGVIGKGLGVSASGNSGINIRDARAITATGNINLYGVGTSGSGVEILGAAALSAANITINGENTGAGGAAINISNASSTLTATAATTLTASGTGSGTSLVAASNISVGTQLKVTTPAAGNISGVISGTGSLLKMGAGQTKLTAYNGTTYGTNTFSGGTTISQGTLLLGNGNGSYNKTAGAGVITLGDANTGNNNVALLIDKGKDAGQAALSRGITVSNNGTGTATIGAAAFAAGTGWTIINSTISLNRDVIFTDATSDRLGLDGNISGTGNITVAGTNSRITMGSTKTFTGNVTVASGNQLEAGVANIFSSTTNMDVNGTFNKNGLDQTINSLTGASTGQVTSSGTLTIGANDGGGTYAGVISNATNLVKNGTGTQILTGNNGYTGTTTINAGTLQIGNGSTTGAIGSGTITDNAALVFNRSDATLVVSAKISGTGNVTQAGTGTTTLSADNDWSGTTTISAGTLQIGNGSTTGTLGTSTTVTNNGTLAFKRSDSISVGQKITGTGGLTQAGNGTMTLIDSAVLNGVNDYSGVTTINAGGTLQVGNGTTVGNLGSGTITDNGKLVINHSDAVALSKIISGSGVLEQSGSGTTTLTAINSYTGGTNVTAGILQIGDGTNNGQIGANTVNISTGATLNFNVKSASSANYSTTNTFTGTGTLKKSGTGTLTWGSAVGVFAMTGGLIDVQGGTFVGSNSGNEVWTNNKASLNIATGASLQGVEGNIIVDALTGNGTLSSGYTGFLYGLTVGVNGGSGTFSGVIQDANAQAAKLTKLGAGTQILTGTNTYTGTTTISGGTLQVGNGGTTGTLGSGAIVDNASLIINRDASADVTIGGNISGTGTLTQSGAGKTILTGTNSYQGTTTIDAGSLQVGNGGATGTLGSGSVINSTALIFKRDATTDLTVNSAISGIGTLSQIGAGKTVLTGSNSYQGTTTISSGTLQVGSGGATGTLGSGAVVDNAALIFNRDTTSDLAVANAITGTGTLTQSGTGKTILSGQNGYTGTTTVSAGTLAFSLGNFSESLTGDFINNSAVTFTANASTTPNGTLFLSANGTTSGTGTWTVDAATAPASRWTNRLDLRGNTSISGAVTVNNYGNLWIDGSSTSTSSVNLNGANTKMYVYGSATKEIGTLTGSGQVGFGDSAGGSTTTLSIGNDNGTGTFTGSISSSAGALSIIKAGSGTQAFAGNNSYTGSTAVSGGTLQIGNGGTTGNLGSTTGVTLSNNANLTFSKSNTTTIDKAISGNGNVSADITGGDLALASAISLTGSNTINLTASGSITETAGSLAATNLYMTATGGSIGTSGQRIQSNVDSLSLSSAGDQFVTETNGITVASRTTNNGSINLLTTNGTLSVGAVNNITGISAHGTGNITLSGTSTSGIGLYVGNNVSSTSGDVSITGTSSATTNFAHPEAGVKSAATISGKDITMVATVTSTTGNVLGYFGDRGSFAASGQLNLTGTTSNASDGFYSFDGSLSSVTGMRITGTSASGKAVGFDKTMRLTNGSGGITITGTATNGTQQAISLRGLAITNTGGDVQLNAINGAIFSDAGDPAWGAQTNTITNSGTGAVRISAGNASATNSGAINGSVLAINQNGNGGVVVSTSGTGNLTAPKVSNAGTGDILVAAGTAIAVGTGTGGQVLTIAGNTLTQTNATPGKTYVYSGEASSTGVLSDLGTGFNTLYYAGTTQALNTKFSTAFDGTPTDDLTGASVSNTQVFFRSATKPGFSMTLANSAKAYGNADPTLSATNGASLTNVYAGAGGNNTFAVTTADVIAGMTGTRTAGENVGSYAYTLDASSFNTTLTAQPNLVIGKRDVTLTGITAANKAFDGTDVATITSGAISTGVGTETLSVSGTGTFSDQNAADGKTVTVADVTQLTKANGSGNWSNYNLTTAGSKTTTANISKKDVVLASIAAANKTYDGTTAAIITSGVIATGVGSETLLVSGAGTFSDKNAADNKTVTVADVTQLTKANGSGNWSNYNLTTTGALNTVANIDKAALSVTATTVTKTYDGVLSATGTGTLGTIAGAGDSVSYAGSQTFLDANAGSNKTVRTSGVTLKDAANADMTGNYTITYTDNVTSVINKAALTVTANADARFVTQADVTGYNGVSYSGFQGADTAAVVNASGLSITRTNALTDVSAGTYTGVLVPTGVTASNYDIRPVSGNYTVVPAAQLLVRTTNQNVTYGTTPTYSTTAEYLDRNSRQITTLTQSGTNNNYTFTDGAGTTVSFALKPYSGANTAAQSTSGNTVVGTYDVKDTAYTQSGNNFTGTPVFVGVVTVDKKAITPTASGVTKVYDGTTSMNNVVVGMTGKLTNDVVAISGSGAFTQKNAGSSLGYSVTGISLASGDASNYYLNGGLNSFLGNDGIITAAPLVITSGNVTKTYDRTTSAAGVAQAAAGSQTFGNDSLSGGTFAFTSAVAGAGNKTVTVSGVTVNDGNNGNNYAVSYADNTTSTITPKALAATVSATGKTYDGTTNATVTASTNDIISGDTVVVSGGTARFDTKHVGTGKTVTATGLSLSGTDAANYTLGNTSATTTADINQAALMVTASQVSKEYDGLTTATGVGTLGALAGAGAGEVVNHAGVQVFTNKEAGAGNKTVQARGVTLKDVNGQDVTANYNISYTDNLTSTITPAPLTIQVNDTAMFVTQDARTATNQGFSYSGFKNGETQATALVGGALVDADRAYSGTSPFPTAGSYSGVYGLATTPTSVNGNYIITVRNGNLTVIPADKLLITLASQSDTYGNRTATNAGQVANGTVTAQYCLVASDCTGANLVNLTMTQLVGTQWKAADNTGSYVVFDTTALNAAYSTGGFMKAGNYTLGSTEVVPLSLPNGNFTGRATNGGVLTINPLAATLSSNPVSKTYDGNTSITGVTVALSNQAAGDVVNAAASTGSFANKEVGTGITVALSNLGLSGADAANYYLTTNALSTTGSIMAANNSGAGTNAGSGAVHPPKPIIPDDNSSTSNSEDGKGSGGGTSAQNPYWVLPNGTPNTADSCTASNLEACTCEEQEAGGLSDVSICYQPKKTASTQASRPRS